MGLIRTLALSITANTRGMEKGLKRAESKLRSFSKFATGGLAGLTGVAGLAGFGFLIAKQAEVIDQSAKMSKRLGIAFQDLTALKDAAEKSGVAVNQLQLGIQRMTRRISEAAQGTGEAQGALKELGFDARALSALAPDKQFLAIARALERVRSSGDKVRLGFKIFDSEGVGLINIAADQIERSAVAMRKFGLELDRLQITSVEDMNDSLTDVKSTFSGLAQQILVGIAPAVQSLADGFISVISAGEGLSRISERFSVLTIWAIKLERAVLRVARVFNTISPMSAFGDFDFTQNRERLRELNDELDILEGRRSRAGGGPSPLGSGPVTPEDIARKRAEMETRKQDLGPSFLPPTTGGRINPKAIDPNIEARTKQKPDPQITRTNDLLQLLLTEFRNIATA